MARFRPQRSRPDSIIMPVSSPPTHDTLDWTELRRRLLLDENQLQLPADWKLPALPRAITQFLQQAGKPDINLRKLSKILEEDPFLTCELLKYVNSSAIGLRHRATTVHQAIVSLGLRRSKLVVLTAAIQASLKKFNSHLFDLHQFWADNLERALFSREMAGELGADLDLSFTAAMLQDFLLPVMAQFHVQKYVDFWHECDGIPCDLIEFERKEFGVQHAQVGAACLLQWNVPDELICGVLCHHMSYEQLQELGLLGTHVHAVACSALLPTSIQQTRDLGLRLAEWDRADAAIDLCDIAERVDAHYQHQKSDCSSSREPLTARLEHCLVMQFTEVARNERFINRQIGHFVLEEQIGEGAMGTVYRARHLLLERPAAVKVLNKQELTPLDIARFEQEVKYCTRLSHPNTISIYDFGRTQDGLFYYVMEYIQGLTLKQLVQQVGPLPAGRVIQILRQVCLSLQEAHEQGIVHRDIKPENIIVSVRHQQGDFVTVLDFGLVGDTSNSGAPLGNACISGTPLYMAPETISRPDLATPSCDLYAIAAVGYYLLCGQPLFTGNDALDVCLKQVSEMPVPPSTRMKQPLPTDLEELIMTCLHKSPEKRLKSVGYLAQALDRCQSACTWIAEDSLHWWRAYLQTTTNPQPATKPHCSEATIILDDDCTL